MARFDRDVLQFPIVRDLIVPAYTKWSAGKILKSTAASNTYGAPRVFLKRTA